MVAAAPGGAAVVDAEVVALPFEAHAGSSAQTGHCCGERPRRRVLPGAATAPGRRTSGMTSPALRTITVSPGRTSLTLHLVLVVQGGHADGGAADEDRVEHRERRRPPGAPDRHLDVAQQGRALLGRELVGDRPARRLRGEPQPLPHRQVVELDHHPVDVVVEVVAVVLPVLAVLVDLGQDRRSTRTSGLTGKPRLDSQSNASECSANVSSSPGPSSW